MTTSIDCATHWMVKKNVFWQKLKENNGRGRSKNTVPTKNAVVFASSKFFHMLPRKLFVRQFCKSTHMFQKSAKPCLLIFSIQHRYDVLVIDLCCYFIEFYCDCVAFDGYVINAHCNFNVFIDIS